MRRHVALLALIAAEPLPQLATKQTEDVRTALGLNVTTETTAKEVWAAKRAQALAPKQTTTSSKRPEARASDALEAHDSTPVAPAAQSLEASPSGRPRTPPRAVAPGFANAEPRAPLTGSLFVAVACYDEDDFLEAWDEAMLPASQALARGVAECVPASFWVLRVCLDGR